MIAVIFEVAIARRPAERKFRHGKRSISLPGRSRLSSDELLMR